ncbi:hypothetical protein Ddc_12791 [Ditylenchus destructor]|nr:hypothetical protein Ddc_12791 [Ditylenchus destructor]
MANEICHVYALTMKNVFITSVIFLIIVTIFPVNGTPEDDAYVSANLKPDANGRLGETRQMSVIHCTTALLGSAVSASSLDYSKLSGQTGKLKENLQAGEQSLKHLMGIQPVFVSMQMKILGAANHLKNMLGLVITEASELREEEKNQSAVLDFLAQFFRRDAATNFINAVKDLKRQLEKKISIWKVK